MARAVTRCPNCGQPVSQFAAGCAVCGENLVAARQRLAERQETMSRLHLERPEWLDRISGAEAILGVLLVIIAIGFPVVSVFISGFVAYFAHRSDEVVQRNLALAAIAVAFAVIVIFSFIPGLADALPDWVNFSSPFPDA